MRLRFGIPEPHEIEGKVYRCGDTIEVADHEAPKWESLGFHREPEPLPFDDPPILDIRFLVNGEEDTVPAQKQAERKPRRRRRS